MELQRFFAKVGGPDANGCWPWLAACKWGYGCFSLDGGKVQVRAHRYSYEVLVGPIAPGFQIDHLCRNRGCVNPAHLEPVTAAVNNRRGEGIAARNARKTHCLMGHEFTPENTYRVKGGRACRECQLRRDRERQERLRLLEAHR